ncbi:hypothetical protein SAMN05444483_102333 [Salegentibacter echinorum]|uniref:Uncharacterized protein n=1 Tax=Salegentibacter echinorum TaxID=1073325 RepID=A0A1M5EDS6_SALEC|nr:hypothetical protein [Salegentibacter echinorum]SHF77310.1 hypothetical protein SAMN05444483_102333 [Salegentibacter echinorum]
MLNQKLKGEIVYFFEGKHQYSKLNESKSFLKQRIVIDADGEKLTISFYDKYIDLLRFCKIGSEIAIDVKLKGSMWKYGQKQYSANELICKSLEIVKNTRIDNWIRYKEGIYNLRKYYRDNNLLIELVNTSNHKSLILCINHSFPNKELNKDHILLWDIVDDELIRLLENKGIITKQRFLRSKDGYSGYICKVLVLDLFSDNEFLFDGIPDENNKIHHQPENRSINHKFTDITDYTHYNEDLDKDQQSEDFWNQF